jgi:hypothetical protein
MSTTNLLLITGEQIEVVGLAEDVGQLLQNAARSTQGTLAWLEEAGSGEALGVNPAHVVTIRAGEE